MDSGNSITAGISLSRENKTTFLHYLCIYIYNNNIIPLFGVSVAVLFLCPLSILSQSGRVGHPTQVFTCIYLRGHSRGEKLMTYGTPCEVILLRWFWNWWLVPSSLQ